MTERAKQPSSPLRYHVPRKKWIWLCPSQQMIVDARRKERDGEDNEERELESSIEQLLWVDGEYNDRSSSEAVENISRTQQAVAKDHHARHDKGSHCRRWRACDQR